MKKVNKIGAFAKDSKYSLQYMVQILQKTEIRCTKISYTEYGIYQIKLMFSLKFFEKLMYYPFFGNV